MILNYIIPIFSLLGSLIAIYFTARKQTRELDNIDADTIKKLYDTIKQQKTMYDETVEKMDKKYSDLQAEFDAYKKFTSMQISALHKESTELRCWAERLCKQLRDNNIQPEGL